MDIKFFTVKEKKIDREKRMENKKIKLLETECVGVLSIKCQLQISTPVI